MVPPQVIADVIAQLATPGHLLAALAAFTVGSVVRTRHNLGRPRS